MVRRLRLGVALVLAGSVLAVGCGGDDVAVTTEAPATTVATTTTIPITTTTMTTTTITTTTTTTTTTVPPWTTLPEPEMPGVLLAVEGGEPVEVGSFCLDGSAEGPQSGFLSVSDSIAGWLRYLGIGVVEDGCDAHLTLTLRASRQSARYSPGNQLCWSGVTVDSEATLLLADGQRQTWAEEFSQAPPDTVSTCNSEDAIIRVAWGDVVFDDAFYEMFGDLGAVVMAGEFNTAGWQTLTTELSESAVQALTFWLVNDPDHFIGIVEDIAEDTAWPEPLRSMTPYVIYFLRCPETQCIDPEKVENDARGILDALTTGESVWTQEFWWDWWEAVSG